MNCNEHYEKYNNEKESEKINNYLKLNFKENKLCEYGTYKKLYLALDFDSGKMMAWLEINFKEYKERLQSKRLPDSIIEESTKKVIKLTQNEYEICSSFNHPNVIKILAGNFNEEKAIFITKYYVKTISTIRFDRNSGPLVKKMCKEVLEGLKYLHQQGIIHRDIKRDNIFYDRTTFVIADLGFAIKDTEEKDFNFGTLEYKAPEVISLLPYNVKIDIYALGITVFKIMKDIINDTLKFLEKEPKPNLTPIEVITILLPKAHLLADFMSSLLKGPDERPTAEEALSHPYITSST